MARNRNLIAPQASPGLKETDLGENDLPPPNSGDSPAHRRLIRKAEDRMRLITIADQISGDPFYVRGYKWDVGNKNFPEDIDAHMRFVTKYYPYTKTNEATKIGPPLYVDEPKNEREVIHAYAKQKLMHKIGLRHIVVEPHRVNPETGKILEASTLEDCLVQLDDMVIHKYAGKVRA